METKMFEWDLVVIMPVYNEEAIIQKVLRDWVLLLRHLKIRFIIAVYNDGSRDKSSEKIKELLIDYPEIRLVDKRNSGHGPTLLQGYDDYILKAYWLFQVDSDDEIPADAFLQLWAHRSHADFILGRRESRSAQWSRLFISFVARTLVQGFGQRLYDVNCPFRLFRSSSFIPFLRSVPKDSFAPNVLMTLYALSCSSSLVSTEVLVPYQLRQTGEVSIKYWKLFKGALLAGKQTLKFLMVRF